MERRTPSGVDDENTRGSEVSVNVRDEEKFWRLGLETSATFATPEKCVKETE
jgi:hypothetical protein